MSSIRSAVRLIAVVLLAGSVSCGLFETRDPAEPEPPDTSCRSLTSAVNVRLNISDAYGRTSLQTCYASLLDPTFRFHPDAQDSLQTPEAFEAWDDSVEAAHNSTVGSQQTFIHVSLVKTSEIVSPDQATETHFCDYTLHVAGVAGDTTLARYTGIADIMFHRGNDGQWRIVDWADHRGSVSDSTWGLLRSITRPGVSP